MSKTLTDEKAEYKTEAQEIPELVDPWAEVDARLALQARTFTCPIDRGTKFHKAEFVKIVDGAPVTEGVTYWCVLCHTEYEIVAGEVRKAGQ